MSRRQPGTYLLWMHTHIPQTISIGKLGEQGFSPGHYAYVGSALGSGGVAARVGRHLRERKRMHWHVDYLASTLSIDAVWYQLNPTRMEHAWAALLSRLGGDVPVKGFGASDCFCDAHLLRFDRRPALRLFASDPLNLNHAVRSWFSLATTGGAL